MNSAYPKDEYLLPQIDALINLAMGFSIMSFQDIFSGYYYKIIMHQASSEKTTFITREGLYSYKVIPFVMKNNEVFYKKNARSSIQRTKRQMKVDVDNLFVKNKLSEQYILYLK